MTLAGKRYWLVGASEGLGRELARLLDSEGVHLILSARNGSRLDSLCAGLQNATAVPLDVCDLAAVRRTFAGMGHIDGVIYNAGVYDPMPATAWNTEATIAMADVNYLGALRVLGEAVPYFLSKGAGEITLIGSLAGYGGLPKAVGYGASKSALISLAETMRHDLKGSGVTVRIVNPGFIATRLTGKNSFRMPMLMQPATAAAHVVKAMRRRRFRSDFPAPFSWAVRAYGCLPDWLLYRGR